MALGMAMITVVGQCIGAKDYEAVKKYTKKLMLITYGVVWAMTLLMLLFSKQILSFYSLSEKNDHNDDGGLHCARHLRRHCLAAGLCPAERLRAANDVRFTMIVSLLSMWIFRIGFSYILAIYFNMAFWAHGLQCVSIGSAAALLCHPLARGKWKNISFIDN